MKALTYEEVLRQLPKSTKSTTKTKVYSSLATVRNLYGPNIYPFTPEFANKYVGKTVYVIEGQDWNYDDIKDILYNITKYKILGFSDDIDNVTSLTYKPGLDIIGEVTKKYKYGKTSTFRTGVHSCNAKLNYWGTGSGCDPIYVFSSLQSSRKTPKRKTAKRKTPKRKTAKRKTLKRKTPKRKTPKRKTPKRKSRK